MTTFYFPRVSSGCRMRLITATLVAVLVSAVTTQERHALFVRKSASHSRAVRAAPDTPADVMARNILEWIQGIYRQGTRKIRQQSEPNAYLPPYSTQRPIERPRPFQPASTPPQQTYSPPDVQYQKPSSQPSYGASSLPTSRPTYIPPATNQQSASSGFGASVGFSSSAGYSPQSIPTSAPPSYSGSGQSTAGFSSLASVGFSSSAASGYPSSPSSGYPSSAPASTTLQPPVNVGYPSASSTYLPPTNTGYPSINKQTSKSATPVVSFPSTTYGYPLSSSPSPGFPTPGSTSESGGYPSSVAPSPSLPSPVPGDTGANGEDGSATSGTGTSVDVNTDGGDDDLKHPPHIHNIDVECSKTMMTINIEFNREFDGVIYSKGYYTNPDCRYVSQNSGQKEYSFTVSLDSCGTQFINDFEGEAGQAYLENVLVLQNEPGIQEVWDTVRRVRCLWEGNINKALSVSLSVDMLNQEIVTFSGDTASARLDIQTGRGPFAPAADGLVKIGEIMTLVVSVEGDPGFDLQVRDCIARDESSTNTVQLTDERGCILKPKLFGAFQKTRDTGNTGASIIAYAFFQAFKFPDVMDLFIECNVELCKTDCDACPDPNQQIEPRKRRDVTYAASNITGGALSDPVRVSRGFKVIMPDDLSQASVQALEKMEMTIDEISQIRNVCMSHGGFYAMFSLLLSFLVITTISTAILYLKLQKIRTAKGSDLPKGH
ncbi:uncharacterized protein LOC107270055 isoform X2 [Cephus cinctus]|uniref:Uncharacterized protein LOC107270055 isoform X2 n=1 Tax=Cephus cinctus TaxID=211228 RepID=A0AAJ7C2D9_CEPCN|nr:uncharacterized protein LOC107270055 isoform X2 [Cephus cinctus]